MKIYDANGSAWSFDGKRVFLLDAEEELDTENGYSASNWEEAVQILNEYGYME